MRGSPWQAWNRWPARRFDSSRTWREFIDRIIDFDEDLAVDTFGGTEPDDIACYLEGMDAELDDPWSGPDDLPHGTDKPWPPFDGFDPGDYPCVPTELWELYDYTENVYGESLHELPSNRLSALLEGLDRLHCTYQMVDSIEVAWQTDGMRVSQ